MIIVKTGGKNIYGWRDVLVEKNRDFISGKIELHTGVISGFPSLAEGDLCELYDGEVLVSTFYADRVKKNVFKTGRSLSIWGREKTCDLVDCNYLPNWEWKSVSMQKIIEDIATPFGIRCVFNSVMPIIDYRANYGDTLANILGDLVSRIGVHIITSPEGHLLFEPDGFSRGSNSYIHGKNFSFCSTLEDGFQSFSQYYSHSQQTGRDGFTPQTVCQVAVNIDDPSVERYRPMLLLPEGSLNFADASKAGEWERAVRHSRRRKIILYLPEWREIALNKKMEVQCEELRVNGLFATSALKLTMESGVRQNVVTLQEAQE